MVADAQGAGRWANWAGERKPPRWIGVLANLALILAVAGSATGFLYLADILSSAGIKAAAIAVSWLAALAGITAFAAHWLHGALASRVDILSQALEASPDPQLIVTPDGRIAYANTAFQELFPDSGEAALDRIAAAITDPDSSTDFERLRGRAAAGARAIAALPLRDARGTVAGW